MQPKGPTSKCDRRYPELHCFLAYIFAIRGESLPGPLRRDSENRIAPVLFHRVPIKKLVLQVERSKKMQFVVFKSEERKQAAFSNPGTESDLQILEKGWIPQTSRNLLKRSS